MKKRWNQILAMGGALLVVQSIFWEYARMRPDYQFIVEPWSFRGFESVHGAVFAAVGAAALISALLVNWQRSQEPRVSVAIAGIIGLLAVAIAAVFGKRELELNLTLVFGIVLSILIGTALLLATRDFIRHRVAFFKTGLGTFLLWLAWVAVTFGVLSVVAIGEQVRMPPAAAIALVVTLFFLVAVGAHPRGLAANRMLISASLMGWATVAFSAGALRSTLIRMQAELDGIAGQYKDSQVTSGWFLANLGMALVFIGSVAMWAKRRDLIMARLRAEEQRKAAEASRKELEEAYEVYRTMLEQQRQAAETAAGPGAES